MLEEYGMGVLEYALVKWQTRALGSRLDKMMIVLPVFVCIGASEDSEKTIHNVRRIVFSRIRSKRTALMVFRRIMFKAKKYFDNQESFYEAKQKVYEMITQNIQMFSLVLDALEGVERELSRSITIVKKNYEDSFEMPLETKRLLEYQERRYFVDENTIS